MTDVEPSSLPDDVQELLKGVSRPVPPAGFDGRVLDRIKGTLGVPPNSGGPRPKSGSGISAAHPLGVAAKMGAWGIPVSLAALVGGVAVGVLGGRALLPLRAQGPAPVAATLGQEVSSTGQPSVSKPLSAEPPRTKEPPAPAVNPPRRAQALPKQPAAKADRSGSTRDEALADERALVEIARTALLKRETKEALEALEAHARQFPQGQLSEERESLWVQALVNAGRPEDARRKAAEFRQKFPDSMMQPAVDAAMESIR